MGCILYWLLVGHRPFLGDTEKEVCSNIIRINYPPLPATISRPWHVLIKCMLREAPKRRWDLLRISEHLYKHSQTPDLPVTEESEEEIKVEERKEETKKPARPRPPVRGKVGKNGKSPVKGRF